MAHKAFKTELKPNNKQKTLFTKHAGCSRFVYNWALGLLIEDYESGRKEIEPTKFTLISLLNKRKHTEFPWMREVSADTQDFTLGNLETAFKRFFKNIKNKKAKAGFPRFKKRGKRDSFSLKQSITVENNRIKLPRIGWVRLKRHDYIPLGKPKSVTISLKAGRWFISVLYEFTPVKQEYNDDILGVDLGIKNLATCSDGTVFKNNERIKYYEKQKDQLQRKLKRQKKGSNSSKRTLLLLQKKYVKIANIRKDLLHKTTSHLVRTKPHGTIVLEDLHVKGMMKNHCLAGSLSRVSLGEFRRQVEYKSKWYGKTVIIADRFYPSSKMDHKTGEINKDLKLSDRIIHHPDGTQTDRDLNAAINLKNYPARSVGGGDKRFIGSNLEPRCLSMKPEENIEDVRV